MPFPPVPPLFGWLQELGPLLVVVFWVIRQVLVANKDKEGGAEAPPEPRPVAPERNAPRREAKPAGGGQGQEGLRDEVDEFLRRVEQMRGDEEADRPPKPRPSLDPFEEPVRRRPKRPAQPPQQAESIELLVDPVGVADEPPAAPSVTAPSTGAPGAQRSVGQLRESQLAENAAHLGEQIAGASERVEARLHEKFDHRLGALGRREPERTPEEEPAEAPSSAPAARIRKMLSEPTGVRDAFVLGEVFRRRGDL